MKLLMITFALLLGFGFAQEPPPSPERKSTISTGERLDSRMYLGFFTVGKGTTTVDNSYHTKNNRKCYKIESYMQTLGIATWISKVNDNWSGYVVTSELL